LFSFKRDDDRIQYARVYVYIHRAGCYGEQYNIFKKRADLQEDKKIEFFFFKKKQCIRKSTDYNITKKT